MFKTKRKIISSLLLIILLLPSILQLFTSSVMAATFTVNYLGQASYGESIVGNFQINGRQAFCMDHDKTTPSTGTVVTEGVLNDDNIAKCLYYGWGGEAQWQFTSANQGIVYTSLAIDHFKNGGQNNTASTFINYVASMPTPQKKLEFSQNNVTAYIEDDIQRTPSILINGDSKYSITINLQDGVTLVNQTKGSINSKTAVVYGGDTIYLKAPLSINGTWTSANINNSYKPQVRTYTSTNSSLQVLTNGYNMILNPTSFTNLTVNWVETGNIKIHKTDSENNKAISNTTFELKNESNKIVGTITTDTNGNGELKHIAPGSYSLVESRANNNYILDKIPIPINISAGQTVTKDITNDVKKGKIKVIKVDLDERKIKLQGVEFKIYDEDGKLVDTIVTDKNGEAISKDLRIDKKYKVQETKTLENYVLNEIPQTVTVQYNQVTNVTFTNEAKKGQIKVIKLDEDFNEIKLRGVEFKIYDEDGKLVDTIVTDKNGEAVSKKLRIDKKYIAKETKTLSNYILNETPQTVILKYNQITDVTFENEHQKGDLKVYKVDKDNNKVTLGNVEFQLYSEEFGKVIGTYRTDVNGEIKIENLRTGNYRLIETKTNKWYNLTTDTDIEIEWNNVTNATIENELKKGQVKVIKIDKDNNEIKLEGVEFEVLDEKDNVLEKIITDENGEAITNKYPVRDFEKLKLRETKTLDTYVLNNEVKTVTLKEDQVQNIIFENEVKKGQIKVIKVDLDDTEIKIPNVEFNVYDEKGNVVDTLITDKNGEAVSKRLPISQIYRVQETKTGKWYVLNEESQTVVLEQDKITDMVFTNEKQKGQIKVIKVDKDNNEILLEGVTFDILDEKGKVVDTIITNEKGEAKSKKLPIDQQYTVVEKETKKGYILTEEMQMVELKQDEITSVTFENEKIKGYVEITKVDSKTKETLKGAKFGIYNQKDELVEELTTDENGKVKSDLLPYGQYYLKELDTGSKYYLLNKNIFKFEITKNNQIIPFEIDNDSVDIKVTVDKEGTKEIKSGEKVEYTFSNVGNESNTFLESFKWFDYIPTNYIRLEKMTTGQWNQNLKYDVYYKTNKSENYILFKKDLNTNQNYNLDFKSIELKEDEYIIETCFDFGKVDIGFKETKSPTMNCISLDNLKDGQIFTNHTKTVGKYYGITVESNSKWSTLVHMPEEKHMDVLPRTGK